MQRHITVTINETKDILPKKPGLKSYEQIDCLVLAKRGWEICVWNCEHECWDDSDGDDFLYDPLEPTHWIDLSSLIVE
jgi:hypothetical protein